MKLRVSKVLTFPDGRGNRMKIAYLKDYPQYLKAVSMYRFKEWGDLKGFTYDEVIESMCEHLQDDQLPLCYIGLVDDQLIGMVCIRKEDIEGVDKKMTPWLASLYVVPEYRKLGYGGQFISLVEEKVKQMNYKELYLFTIDPTLPTWYEKLGFQPINVLNYNGYTSTVMHKTL